MRKVIHCFLVIILMLQTTFCSKDNGNNNLDDNNSDSIVGSWVLNKITENGKVTNDNCPLGSAIEFLETGKYDAKVKIRVEPSEKCETTDVTGTWSNDGKGVYTIGFIGNVLGDDEKVNVTIENSSLTIESTSEGDIKIALYFNSK